MDFMGLVSSRLQRAATRSAGIDGDPAGCALLPEVSATNLDVRAEDWLAERTRIAQELHDTLLQDFLSVSTQLRAAVERLPANCAGAKPRFDTLLQAMDRVLDDGRRAVQGLRSSQECFPSLGEALAAVPNDLGLLSAVGFQVVVEGRQRDLSGGVRDELYRVGREAIINAFRHSRAKHIETEIGYRSSELRIAVRDNGCGIDPQALQRNGHWGLQGMRERAERIGARLRILSRVALGTEVELSVPNRVAFGQGRF
jgi:signal transduction histidine kinase